MSGADQKSSTPPAAPDVHVPVMRDRIVELLAPSLQQRDAVLVDCTLGLAGHSLALLDAFSDTRLIGIDRDADALAVAEQRLARHHDRVTLVQAVYDEVDRVVADQGLASVSAVLMDLGLSSLQIDRADRGFAYAVDAPLDMRMDQRAELTAEGVVNGWSEAELVRILRRYAEERFADRIARAIVAERSRAPITTSARLVEIVTESLPAAARYAKKSGRGSHPAKRTFQALRIAVNDELAVLARALPAAVGVLGLGGRIAVLAYHSGEDRQVKQVLAAGAADRAPRDLPVVPEELQAELRLLTRGAEQPGEDEINDNPRAASARLRAAERVREVR
ncbi:MAG TPA: 16S rRNA (cytosine(1402)-N(4))-methyltransferase RsmH [Candidatus Avipropionibacterium avicola]|uniref:Ribosomal RNA small subunit methyltransferase H n=1 Tax=Candidatus Avipropionibacterium avicola TaxID=2840701 RepID=A0A9D1GZJ9_9ACTN|nr:16S rRNA (cytosine(1402)-N(4))-methyltransferase RsmH [Candidatus Avipropionibacterium avicola]